MDAWSDRAPDPQPTPDPPPTRRSAVERLRPAIDAIVSALAAPSVPLDALRHQVIRYGAVARDQALQLEDMLATLTRGLRAVLDAMPDMRRTEVLAFVQWWALHGYHRAD